MNFVFLLVELMDDWLYKLEKVFIVGMFSIMLFAIAVNVLCRYVFHYPVFWLNEMVNYLLVYVVLVGASAAYKNGEHIKVKLPAFKEKYIAQVINCIIIISEIIFMGFMVSCGFELMFNNLESYTGVLPVPMSVIYASIPLCGIFLFIHSIAKVFGQLKKTETGE